jgi:hypothetical protein
VDFYGLVYADDILFRSGGEHLGYPVSVYPGCQIVRRIEFSPFPIVLCWHPIPILGRLV